MTTNRSSLGVRTRLISMIVLVTSFVVISIAGYFVVTHRNERAESVDSRIALMRGNLEKRGAALTRVLALASERAIAVMDYLFLNEAITTAVENDEEIIYGIIMDNSRRALIHSNPGEANKVLQDESAKHAAGMDEVGTHTVQRDGASVVEAVAPVFVGGERWGTIRFGLSQERVIAEATELRRRSSEQTGDSIMMILILAAVLLMLGSLVGSLVAGRILRPLEFLTRTVQEIRGGSTTARAQLSGSPEFIALGEAFNGMTDTILQRDRTLRSRNEQLAHALQEAQAASQAKSAFLANVSHELRTPLHAIVNVPKMLLRDYASFEILECQYCNTDYDPASAEGDSARACPECGQGPLVLREKLFVTGEPLEHQQFLHRLKDQAHHLLDIVNDILDLSKLEARSTTLEIGSVEVPRLFEELQSTTEPLAIENRIGLTFTITNGPIELRADQAQLRQVLINLVGNAVKFTDAGGEINVIVTQKPPGLTMFEVRDSGCGIPKDKVEMIFESFRQADSSHTRRRGGTGLGLAISRQIVELHGGKIWVESELDVGTSFFVELPSRGPEDSDPPKENA